MHANDAYHGCARCIIIPYVNKRIVLAIILNYVNTRIALAIILNYVPKYPELTFAYIHIAHWYAGRHTQHRSGACSHFSARFGIVGRFAASTGIALRGMPPTPDPTIEEYFASCLYVCMFV